MKEGLFHLIYFTWLHNEVAIGFALAAITSLILLIRRPKRSLVFLFIGFLLLLFHFEYQKHIVGDLAEQTVNTVFIEEGNFRARNLTNDLLYHFVPFCLWFAGWGSVIFGLISNWCLPCSKSTEN